MKQFLLATALIALPVAVFAAGESWLAPAATAEAAPAASLGDLSAYETITRDTLALVEKGDLVAAEQRITDLETQWDDAEVTMRPLNPVAWGNVDTAADETFSALRAKNPDATAAAAALATLEATLIDPAGGGTAGGGVKEVSGVAVTHANGHAIPCETMLGTLRDTFARDGAFAAANLSQATDLQAKATERCNADDDTRADAFAAQALALAAQ